MVVPFLSLALYWQYQFVDLEFLQFPFHLHLKRLNANLQQQKLLEPVRTILGHKSSRSNFMAVRRPPSTETISLVDIY